MTPQEFIQECVKHEIFLGPDALRTLQDDGTIDGMEAPEWFAAMTSD